MRQIGRSAQLETSGQEAPGSRGGKEGVPFAVRGVGVVCLSCTQREGGCQERIQDQIPGPSPTRWNDMGRHPKSRDTG